MIFLKVQNKNKRDQQVNQKIINIKKVNKKN